MRFWLEQSHDKNSWNDLTEEENLNNRQGFQNLGDKNLRGF
jgi:hypothetical protein